MYAQLEKPKENKNRVVANSVTQKKSGVKQSFGFVDSQPDVVAQRKVQKIVNNRPQTKQTAQLQSSIGQLGGGISELQYSMIAQREVERDEESSNAKLQKMISTLENIIIPEDIEVDPNVDKELKVYINDLKSIMELGDQETKRITLEGLYKEANSQLDMTPMEVPHKMPKPISKTLQQKPKVAQRVLGAVAIAGIAIVSVGGAALLGYGIYKLVKRIRANRMAEQRQRLLEGHFARRSRLLDGNPTGDFNVVDAKRSEPQFRTNFEGDIIVNRGHAFKDHKTGSSTNPRFAGPPEMIEKSIIQDARNRQKNGGLPKITGISKPGTWVMVNHIPIRYNVIEVRGVLRISDYMVWQESLDKLEGL